MARPTNGPFTVRALIVAAMAIGGLPRAVVAQRVPDLFKPPPGGALLTPKQQEFIKSLQLVPAAIGTDVVQVEKSHLTETEAINVRPVPGAPSIVLRGHIEERTARDFTWVGTDPASGKHAVITVVGRSVAGTIWSDDIVYDVRPLGDGLFVAVSLDPRLFPLEHGYSPTVAGAGKTPPASQPVPFPSSSTPSPAPCLATPRSTPCPTPTKCVGDGVFSPPFERKRCEFGQPSGMTTITVLAAYTAAAARMASADGDHESIEAETKNAVKAATVAYRQSGVNAKLELVHCYKTEYTEEGMVDCSCIARDRDRFAGRGDGYMDEVHQYRDAYAADVAVLLTGSTCCPGVAYELPQAEYAFAVASMLWATSNYSLAHEIGHVQGAQHYYDEEMAAFDCGHGFCYQYGLTDFYTIMTNPSECCRGWLLPCKLIPGFSNPARKYRYNPTGDETDNHYIPTGDKDHNNAAVLNETASRLANFRNPGHVTASPELLLVSWGQSRALEVSVLNRQRVPVPRAPVNVTVVRHEIATAVKWHTANPLGRAKVPIRGFGVGTTLVEIRAEGALVKVKVEVVPYNLIPQVTRREP